LLVVVLLVRCDAAPVGPCITTNTATSNTATPL
jgi:hypothetical protein